MIVIIRLVLKRQDYYRDKRLEVQNVIRVVTLLQIGVYTRFRCIVSTYIYIHII